MPPEPALVVTTSEAVADEVRSMLRGEGIAQVEAAAGWSSALALFTWHDFALVVIHDHDGTGAELADEIRVRWGQIPTLIFKEKLTLN
ncbi:hypothetical protein [Alsobacter sp. SYSU BS001988]